jgi:hypothetical protein
MLGDDEKEAREAYAKCVGKTIQGIEHADDRADDYLNIHFTDGTKLRIHYDWLYSVRFVSKP